jgi:GNAT superfamily N-acetyltransferase
MAAQPRTFMRAVLRPSPPWAGLPGVRLFKPRDEAALGPLMLRAYRGTVDDEGETVEEAVAEVRKTLSGGYGDFMPACSMVAERDSHVVSATLVTRLVGQPFVAFTFTDPACQGQGLAGACIRAAMAQLLLHGERELGLMVTLANTPAVSLYARLGFVAEPG